MFPLSPTLLPQAFPSYRSLNLFLSLTFPLPSKNSLPKLPDRHPLPPRQRFAFFNTDQVSIAVQNPTILTETPPLAASRANPWWTSCRALERLHLCVFSSHMDTHTELLLTLGERRSNHQLLAKQLLFLSPGYQRNPSLPFPSSTALLWLTDLALLPVNCKIGFR